MHLKTALLMAAALALAGFSLEFAFAGSDDEEDQAQEARDLPTVEEFLAFQEQLRADLEEGKYGTVPEDQMELVIRSQATLNRILSGVEDIGELPLDDRVEAYNAQEAVKAVLADNLEDLPICRRRHTVGTNFKVTTCYTRREMRLMRDRARAAMEHMGVIAPLPDRG